MHHKIVTVYPYSLPVIVPSAFNPSPIFSFIHSNNADEKLCDNSHFTAKVQISPWTAQIFDIVWGEGGSKNPSNRTTCVGVIRVEEYIVKFSCFLPSLVSVQGIMTCIEVILGENITC